MKRIFALSCGFYLLIGITSVFMGSLLPELLSHYERGYSDGGTLLFLQFLGFLAGVIASPIMSTYIGRRSMLLIALCCITAACLVMGFLPSWMWIILMVLFVGFGSGIIESSIGAFTIEYAEEGKAVAMAKLDVFFGVGALLIPAVVSLCITLKVWPYTFFTISGITLILVLLWMTMPAASSSKLHTSDKTDSSSPVTKTRYTARQVKLLAIFIVFFFVYMGLELGFMNFLPSILIETIHIPKSLASLSVTFLWIAMVIGRLFVGRVAESVKYLPFLFWSTLGSLFFIIAMALNSSEWATYLLIFGIGVFMSGLFAIALVYANSLIPGMTESTTSILIASGGIGGAILQYVIGWSMTEWPVSYTVWILAGFTVILLVTIGLSHQWNIGNKRVSKQIIQPTNEM
ncbi:MFS transporter [Paenibacillus zeisoli]|uniref:MFS transporter n=1 Tax=Paenibacillus zeisoli TaxID=2496267 RepID=A0A3S1B907_9BACL|nr:MFS transporter [Paenibacillus zeisoli]RUT35720.1 MFS transporter [Paenibacillus zeisoli]